MASLSFNKKQLINLEHSLKKEMLRTNTKGAFSLSTIVGCNTRKYHGLLICPIKELNNHKYILLSSLDESILKDNTEFNLGLHKYEGDNYSPKGHKYIEQVDINDSIVTTYKIGDLLLKKEFIFNPSENQILVKYTLDESTSKIRLRIKPFLAFRNIHELSRANLYANTKVEFIHNGVKGRLYEKFPYLNIQFSKDVEFIQVPLWYYNIEYMEELKRGYDYKEDLLVPGYFEFDLSKGESVILSGSTKEEEPDKFHNLFSSITNSQHTQSTLEDYLLNAARQFFIIDKEDIYITAGFPWFSVWGRDTFIAQPGLSCAMVNPATCQKVLLSMTKNLDNGLFPNLITGESMAYNSVDAPLLFIRALQLCQFSTNNEKWEIFGSTIKSILSSYKQGITNIKMHSNGLIYAGNNKLALTWMDAIANNTPVTPRTGYQVEINALWYNAICYALELAKNAQDKEFLEDWKDLPAKIKNNYIELFWDEDKKYLADYVDDKSENWQVRPNMIIATALHYSPLERYHKIHILERCTKELLTEKGLRTLSPKDNEYCGSYTGDQEKRDKAYHQGTVWPWLLEFYSETYLKLHGKEGSSFIQKIIEKFETELINHGIGSISEIYDGDPPHCPRGAISQAWSVSALLRMKYLIEEYS